MVRDLAAVAVLLAGLLVPHLATARPERPTPVFFAPLRVAEALGQYEVFLRRTLTARLLATGKYAAAVTAETEEAIRKCVGQVNIDANAEQCWVRIGQGQGAELMVTGEVAGTESSCDIAVQLLELETRVSSRMYVEALSPCAKDRLGAAMDQAALVLSGAAQETVGAPPPFPRATLPATPERAGQRGWTTFAWAGTVAGVGLGMVGAFVADSGRDATDSTSSVRDLEAGNDRIELGKTLQYVGFGAAAVGLTAALLLLRPGGQSAAAASFTSPQMGATLGLGAASLVVRF